MAESRRKPKVAFVTPGTFTVPSDYSSSVERVVDEISKRMAEEADVYVFSKKSPGTRTYEKIAGVTHIRPIASTRSAYRTAVLGWLQKLSPDLIQVENRPLMVSRVKRAVRKAEVWLSLHSVTFTDPDTISRDRLRRALNMADRVVVNSQYLREELSARNPYSREKILVNHLGTDVERFQSQWESEGMNEREAFKRELGYEGKRIVLFAGRLIPIKGVHHLLQVWPDVVRKFPEAVLLVIGSAFYGSNRITPYVRKLHLMGNKMPRNVRFLSYVPYSEMPRWFQTADVVAVPSESKEAFGLVNVEAMASGAPVIASNSGGMKEIVRHGDNGYLVEQRMLPDGLRERIMELLEDDKLRRKLGVCGAETARTDFSWQRTAERQLELYYRYTHIFGFGVTGVGTNA